MCATSEDFRQKNVDPQQLVLLSRRAERLVIALERLVLASNNEVKLATDSELNELFSLVQSLPDFDPAKFADALKKFSAKLP